jgi:hypothetical protein
VYGAVRWVETGNAPALEVDIHPRVGSRGLCSGCGRQRAGYDRLSPRRFEFVPLWGMSDVSALGCITFITIPTPIVQQRISNDTSELSPEVSEHPEQSIVKQ